MTTAYITESNFSKIAKANLNDITDNIMDVCRRVYESRDVLKYLNHKEILHIECKRLLLESTEECVQKHIERVQEARKNVKQNAIHSPYVFVSTTPPKYHYNRECEFLSKDFLNFLIPPEIDARGKKEIQRFREFAHANKQLVLDEKTYLFILRLKTQFNLTNDISKITLTNTGVKSVLFEDLDLDVSREIDDVLNEIDNIGKTKSGEITLYRYRYMDYWKRHQAQNSDELSLLISLKSKLVDLIMKFHLQNNSMNGFSFDEELLASIGFERCTSCGKRLGR